jgi:hypothetical protein
MTHTVTRLMIAASHDHATNHLIEIGLIKIGRCDTYVVGSARVLISERASRNLGAFATRAKAESMSARCSIPSGPD